MPCENFQDAIREAAAAELRPEGKLRSHLVACDECRAALAFEQSLYASIDSGVRVVVNSDVPPSMLSHIRAQLRKEDVPKRMWISEWPFLAGLTARVLAVLLVTAVWQLKTSNRTGSPSSSTGTSSGTLPVRETRAAVRGIVPPKTDFATRRLNRRINFSRQENSASGNPEIAVLVPPDQEVLLANYAKELRRKNIVLVVAKETSGVEPAPLQIDSIQIAQLEVESLAGEPSE